MNTDNALTVVNQEFLAPTISLAQFQQARSELQKIVKDAMHDGTDYGVIPGTGTKPTLLLPGAQKLCRFFGLRPSYELLEAIEDWTGEGHGGEPFFYYRYRCALWRGDMPVGEGVGSCNSWEKKYRYRKAERVCPQCGKATIIKGKAEYGPAF